MQIDFHHAVTYVAARLAGFAHADAATIAYAAQYVDDATAGGPVWFDNKAMYWRISSAHKTIDPSNFDNAENHLVWMPFHFLPGNGGLEAGQNPDGSFINKIICQPDSQVAKDLLEAAFRDRDKAYALHRLGIAIHVYADSWAHQGFAGVLHEVNEVEDIDETDKSGVFESPLADILQRFLEDAIPPLGHGRAMEFPDMPFLSWQYKNGKGKMISRNNTVAFCQAADSLCKAMQTYRSRIDRAVRITGIPPQDMAVINDLFSSVKERDGTKRHHAWIGAIAAGRFSFGSATVSYDAEGSSSWKAQALGTSSAQPAYPYKEAFLGSDWKLFHDALQLHSLTLRHDILPKYGICA